MKFPVNYLFILFFIFSCRPVLHQSAAPQKEIFSIDSLTPPHRDAQQLIAPYKKQLDAQMDKVITYNPYILNKDGLNSNLALVSADALLAVANEVYQKNYGKEVDAALTNSGGLRRNFTPGNLTVRSIYELMPFENEVVVVRISGQKFKEMIEYLRKGKGHPIAGFSFARQGEDSDILIKNQPFDVNKTYTIATTDFLQKGGDGMDFLANPIELHPLDLKLRGLFIQYFEKSDTIKINTTPRYR
ncbi:bifunctional UDP-sugar hydrolase/5'-nucleotidase periplasmic precursor [Candidatus Ornithobacterium hominis]|uniref:5'-nucleotidase C-terminal domain-containing protein n=1 Tax=Candidatus Ornithobacterium hominis TaxID=2497989 RepID=UPI000E94AD4C|nr:5'-nucleotidase [Candidatus Ornithobacterium hominis]SZD73756.1 bifunctional UDP-sugar hydrolase/5'-nucleotidase periplasmic precursor [Candidatus Ornithobacterium hominis]